MSQDDSSEPIFYFERNIERYRKTFMGNDRKVKDFTKENIMELIKSNDLLMVLRFYSFTISYVHS